MSSALLIASNNPGKIKEFQDILGPTGLPLLTPTDVDLQLDVPETGATFSENATLKASAFARASGLTALADDSGLVVDALNGEPGIYSARYAGENATDDDRIALILAKLRGTPGEARAARFLAALALAHPGHESVELFEGRVDGYITDEPRGSRGFGYDPIFFLPAAGKTFGEMDATEKSRYSHRGQALKAFAGYVRERNGILE